MTTQIVTLAVIAWVSFFSPYIASLIPGRPIPETVFLVFAGAILGPFGLQVITTEGTSLNFLSELGLAFLFLLAGYEIEMPKLTGNLGKHAAVSWFFSLGLALSITWLVPIGGIQGIGRLALAIAMTTTAYGTLAPILRERGLMGTKAGDAVNVYGAIGELLPVIAIALLLSTRAKSVTIAILALFTLICIIVVHVPVRAQETGSKIISFLRDNAETGSQAPVRITVALLVGLVALSMIFDLDAVLGAFAAGMILRATLPEGDRLLETKLEGIAFGFLVPAFFVISGANIDLSAVGRNPLLLVEFMVALVITRAIPIFVSLKVDPETSGLSLGQKLSTSIYCTMALPLIVAVTSISVDAHAMSEDVASVLVSAGALTVFIVPLLTAIILRISAAHPVEAIQEISEAPHELPEILQRHGEDYHDLVSGIQMEQDEAKRQGLGLSSLDVLISHEDVVGDFCTLDSKEENR